MFDKELITEIIGQITDATEKILKRFNSIKRVDDFYESEEGLIKLDSICMLLIAIGESLKNIDKITDGNLLSKYPQIDWRGQRE